ncbi:hypothetical protein CYMTET_34765 [Cymbomonas tetramitiformis]|uniref:Uncharacterized protein n=1 Tax=Cymbomonas tetramitiformis TaxID=36881 RepID=A0AAE0KPJ5_9CHLO|nr:hypothetical protein CYMTET_34765 [Cymbomonas tetramitiformis]
MCRMQVIGSYSQFNIDWPKDIDTVTSLVSDDSGASLLSGQYSLQHNLNCELYLDFFDRYYLQLLFSLMILSTFFVMHVASCRFIKDARSLQVFRMVTLKAAIFVFFIVYPMLSVQILRAFPCREINGVAYMVHDLSVECYTTRHAQLLLVGGVCGLALFICGVPLFFWGCMLAFKVPHVVRQKELDAQMANLLVYFAAQPLIDMPQHELMRRNLDPKSVEMVHAHFRGERLCCDKDRASALQFRYTRDKADATDTREPCLQSGTLSSSDHYEFKVAYVDPVPPGERYTTDIDHLIEPAKNGHPDLQPNECSQADMLLEYMAKQPNTEMRHFTSHWRLSLDRSEYLPATLKMERDAIIYIGFLFAAYRPEYWYFEIIETVRKLLFVSIPVLCDEIKLQLLLSGIVCIGYLSLLIHCKPNSSDLTHFVKLCHTYTLILYNMYGWMMLANVVDDSGANTTAGSVLAALLALAIAVPCFLTASLLYQSLAVEISAMFQWIGRYLDSGNKGEKKVETIDIDIDGS